MTKYISSVFALSAIIFNTASDAVSFGIKQLSDTLDRQDCDPDLVCCAFTQEVRVEFDEDHSYVLNDQASRDAFVIIHRNWVNLQILCDLSTGGDYVFTGIVFDERKKKASRKGRSDGMCTGKRCKVKYVPTGPDRKQAPWTENMDGFRNRLSSGPCEDTLIHTLQVSNPQYFGDVTNVTVSLNGDVAFSDLPPVSLPTAVPVSLPTAVPDSLTTATPSASPPEEDECRLLHRMFARAGFPVSSRIPSVVAVPSPSTFHKSVTVDDAVCPEKPPVATLTPSSTPVTWPQLGDTIDGGEPAFLGYSVVLSGDGSRLAAGGEGVMRLLDFVGGAWTHDASFTFSSQLNVVLGVAMTLDGNCFLAGDPLWPYGHDVIETGAVFVFVKDSTTWTQRGSTLTGGSGDLFGRAVGMSDDGDTFAVGTEADYVTIFAWDGSNNVHDIVKKLVGAANSFFGESIAMTRDGVSLVVGAHATSVGGIDNVGSVFVYNLVTYLPVSTINGAAEEGYFGIIVCISADATYLAVGAGNDYEEYKIGGYVKLYKFQDNKYDQFGDTIFVFQPKLALSADGSRLAVTAQYNDENGRDSGKTFLYDIGEDGTLLIGEILGQEVDGYSGESVAFSEDGRRVVIGSPFEEGEDSDYRGYIRVYESSY